MSAQNAAASRSHGAPPVVAAGFAAVTLSLWTEAVMRIWFSMGGDGVCRLWAARAGDIAALWLAVSLVALLAFAAFALLWRGRASVWTIPAWTIVLVVSAIVAPLVGEWGQAIGV